MSYFKNILSLVSVFALLVLVGLLGASEIKAQTSTDTETNTQECVQEGQITNNTVSPEYQNECCEGLESRHLYYYENDSTERMMGSGSLCYDPSQGIPECVEEGDDTVEGWYYPEGDLLMEFECKVEGDDEDVDMDDDMDNDMDDDEDMDMDDDEEEEMNDSQERERISNVEQMRYYRDIIRKEDGALYGVRKGQELINRIEGNNRAGQADLDDDEERENEAREMVQERKEEIERIRKNVEDLTSGIIQNLEQKIEELQNKLEERDEIIERQEERINYVAEVLRDEEGLSDNIKVALSEFISKGTKDNSEKIGEGERAAVLNSYKHAFGHLPQNETEIEDAIKISNGRFPAQTSEEAENNAKIQFERIYNREADMNNPNDSAAVNIMAYGLKQKAQNRNLGSELKGISIFEDIFGHVPASTEDWNTMQAITYSGAKR